VCIVSKYKEHVSPQLIKEGKQTKCRFLGLGEKKFPKKGGEGGGKGIPGSRGSQGGLANPS